MSMKVTAGCSLPPRLFLLERKKNRVDRVYSFYSPLWGNVPKKCLFFMTFAIKRRPPF